MHPMGSHAPDQALSMAPGHYRHRSECGRTVQGAPEIQSYCLGHSAFVTCSAFLQLKGRELLLSGSGDGTVRYYFLALVSDN